MFLLLFLAYASAELQYSVTRDFINKNKNFLHNNNFNILDIDIINIIDSVVDEYKKYKAGQNNKEV